MLQVARCTLQVAVEAHSLRLQVPNQALLDSRRQACNLQPVTGNRQPATGNLQPATGNLQPATCNLQHG